MEWETDKTHYQIKTTKRSALKTQKRGRKMKVVIQKWGRRGIFLSLKVTFLVLSLSKVQIHTVRRRCLINFILFTSELNF